MALFGSRFATQQTNVGLKIRAIQSLRNPPFIHQFFKPRDIARPIGIGAIIAQDFFRRRERGQMNVRAVIREPREQVRQIALLRKPGQLPAGIEPNVNEFSHAIRAQGLEKIFRALLRKANREQFHSRYSQQRNLLRRWLAHRFAKRARAEHGAIAANVAHIHFRVRVE